MYLNYNAYRLPILISLSDRGGEAPADDVLGDVYSAVRPGLTYNDVSYITSGEIAWRNRARWVKHNMLLSGDLEQGSKIGLWKISAQGRKNLKKWLGV